VMILEPLYEQQFLDSSYGFRPGRSAHQALDALWQRIMPLAQCWLIELDIESFFDRVDRARLREMMARRVSDGVILRVIGKWLQAGVLEGTQLSYPEQGTPQGGVITPRTQKVTSCLNVWLPGGEALQCLICVSRGNMFTTDGPIDPSGQGATAKCGSSPARAQRGATRGGADSLAQVRPIGASSISIPGRSRAARCAGRGDRGDRADHPQTPAEHGPSVAHVRPKQWFDYRGDRHPCAGCLFWRAKKAWLNGAPDAPFKSILTTRLIDCVSRSSRKPTTFWYLNGNA
jgi:Reverse transcriptase (RNA-dependent DNA polymerase)